MITIKTVGDDAKELSLIPSETDRRRSVKKADVKIGERYIAKVSGKLVIVCIHSERRLGGWWAKNTKTGRTVSIKTAARLQRRNLSSCESSS